MGLIQFVMDAGEKLLGLGKESGEKLLGLGKGSREESNREMAQALSRVVQDLGLKVEDLNISYNKGLATVEGTAPSQMEREKIVLVVGNTQGVAQVDDQLKVETPEPEAVMYTVQKGDSLSKIAKAHYGDAMKYPAIFEANKPMLKDPDKIYPGQTLRIPPQAQA
jgi:nucleoid-associated protein YgaU